MTKKLGKEHFVFMVDIARKPWLMSIVPGHKVVPTVDNHRNYRITECFFVLFFQSKLLIFFGARVDFRNKQNIYRHTV